jgi:hypothetical protein
MFLIEAFKLIVLRGAFSLFTAALLFALFIRQSVKVQVASRLHN